MDSECPAGNLQRGDREARMGLLWDIWHWTFYEYNLVSTKKNDIRVNLVNIDIYIYIHIIIIIYIYVYHILYITCMYILTC